MKPEFWPGTGIVKSMGNAFTERPDVVMATKAEMTRAKASAAGTKGREAHKVNTLGNLSKKAQNKPAHTPRLIVKAKPRKRSTVKKAEA